MKHRLRALLYCTFLLASSGRTALSAATHYPVVIIGGGASGTAAAVTAARMGTRVLLLEAGPWLGGMLTAGGVSASDGNHGVATGFWREFRDSLRSHYGGAEALATGWVSHTLFEPRVGQRILRSMVRREENIRLALEATWSTPVRAAGRWRMTVNGNEAVTADVLIDATELADVAAALGVPYDIGMDARADSGESFAPRQGNDIIQDLTYVATLKEYGPGEAPLVPKPPGYDPAIFRCACDTADPAGDGKPRIDCRKMLDYGKLPNGRYMINWPNCGNDFYANLIEADRPRRDSLTREAKLHTLRFVYFLQRELGFTDIGLDAEQYPTEDGLPLIPYHRESRRIEGLVRFNVHDLTDPYGREDPLFRTSIASGDYPIDHHHKMRPDAPAIDFIRIKAPAYGLPLGTLIPREVDQLIVAEKSVSVSNIVNGTTRLQPVVLGIGQAAGVLAALASGRGVTPADVPVRAVQKALLSQRVALLPFFDVPPEHPRFAAIQRVAATGILRGAGVPYKWANQLWFYPGQPISEFELVEGMRAFYPELNNFYEAAGAMIESTALVAILRHLGVAEAEVAPLLEGKEGLLSRAEIAVILDELLAPFSQPVDHHGHRITTN